jgi:hypothetical protein
MSLGHDIVRYLLGMAALTAVLAVGLPYAPPVEECVTASWCLSSHEEPLSFAVLAVVSLLLAVGASGVGFALARVALESSWRWQLVGGGFVALGLFGIAVWAMVSSPEERAATWHVVVIGCGIIAVGLGVGSTGLSFPGRRAGDTRRARDRRAP